MSEKPEKTSNWTENRQDSPSIEERGILSRLWQFLSPNEKRKIQEVERNTQQGLAALREENSAVPDGDKGEGERGGLDWIGSQDASSSDSSTDIPSDRIETTQTPQTDTTPELPENKTGNIPEQPATIQPRMSEEHLSQEWKLNNVGSITVNDMFDEWSRPPKLTLQIPKGTGSAKQKVDEDTPHEVHWDEKQGSYVFSSGPFEGKRPLIKDGMILTPSTDSVVEGAGMSPSGGKEVVSDVTEVARPKSEEESQNALLWDVQLRSAETKNAKFFDSQPEIKWFVMENLPKYMWYKGEIDNKQLSSLIAQFQKDNNLPVDGYITGVNSPTGKLLLQILAEKKVVETWKSGDIWGNNYLPDGTKFVAPISENDIKKLTESWKTDEEIKQIIADASQHCAPFVTYMNGAIRGNAWTMPGRILDENGKEIANTLRGLDWGDLSSTKPQTDEIQRRIKQAIKDNPIPTDQIEVGDVITMMHPGSKYQERAMVEWLSDKKWHGIVSTHIWQVTEANGKLFVTHNIHGTISTEPLEKILAGTWSQWDIATGVFRLNSKKNIVATVQRTVARATNALWRKEPDARSE